MHTHSLRQRLHNGQCTAHARPWPSICIAHCAFAAKPPMPPLYNTAKQQSKSLLPGPFVLPHSNYLFSVGCVLSTRACSLHVTMSLHSGEGPITSSATPWPLQPLALPQPRLMVPTMLSYWCCFHCALCCVCPSAHHAHQLPVGVITSVPVASTWHHFSTWGEAQLAPTAPATTVLIALSHLNVHWSLVLLRTLPDLGKRQGGNGCPARAQRAIFLLTIPTSAPDVPSHGEAPQVDHSAVRA